jgi:serine/threonine-protein kinase
VWRASKLLVLAVALLATYLVAAAVTIRIALKAREVTAPDLAGRTVNDASALLAEVGLTLKVEEGRRVDPRVGPDRILLQEPAAGAVLRQQRSVRVWLSAGPRTTAAPRLLGESERSAQMRLQQDGYTESTTAEIRSDVYPSGAVIAQDPPPGSGGGRIALLVNRGVGQAAFVMPDLIGVDGDRGAELLRARGIRTSVAPGVPYPGLRPGIVIRQSPPAGFRIAPDDLVSLEVSR